MAKRIEEIILKVSIKADKANQQISTLNKKTQKATTASNKFGSAQDKANVQLKKSTSSVNGLSKSMLRFAGITGAALLLKRIADSALDVAVRFDKINKAMETVFETSGKVESNMSFLSKTSKFIISYRVLF